MAGATKFVTAGAIFCIAVSLILGIHQTPAFALAGPGFVFLFLVFFVAAVVIAIDRRKEGWRAGSGVAVILVVTIATWYAMRPIHLLIRRWELPSYEAVVRDIQSGQLQVGAYGQVPGAVPRAHFALQVIGEKMPNGTLLVEFLTDHPNALYSAGYVYTSSGEIEPNSHMAQRWPTRSRIGDHWFAVAY